MKNYKNRDILVRNWIRLSSSVLTNGNWRFQIQGRDYSRHLFNSIKHVLGISLLVCLFLFTGLAGEVQANEVTSFTLVNAVTDSDIQVLRDGDVINLSKVGKHLNIRANTNPVKVGSVRFSYDGKHNYRTENFLWYTLAGDPDRDYDSWTPSLGSHKLTARPFSKKNARGTAGTPLTINFTVVEKTISPNQSPVASDASVVTEEGQSVKITLKASDPDGDQLVYDITVGPKNGTLNGIAPALTYTPHSNFSGKDSFEFQVDDGNGGTDTAIVSIAVNPIIIPNTSPTANDASVVTEEGQSVKITLKAFDPDGDQLAYAVTADPKNGSLNGTAPILTYTPAPTFSGNDSFEFQVDDGNGGTDTATVSITVNPSETDGLVAHWPMDEGSGTTTEDVTGNGNTGTLVNGPRWASDSALDFDGADDYVNVGTMDMPGSAMTLAAWFWSDDLANCSSKYRDCRIISKATGTSEQDHYAMVSTINSGDNTRLRFRLKTNGTTKTLIASSGNIVEGQWVHVAAVYDGASMRLYKDGVEVGKTSKSGTITNKSGVSCWIGGNPPSATARPWEGRIDDVCIYNHALTGQEIQELASGKQTPPPNQPPVAAVSSNVTSGTTPLTVQFDGSGSSDPDGTIASYKWNFANGLSSSSVSPKHVFDTEGSYQVTLTVTDNDGATDKATKTITVTSPTPSNQLPVAKNDDASTQVDSEVSINVLSNDYDADGDDLTITDVTLPSNGIADFDDTTAYYTPNAGFTGTDRFDYMINDGFGGTASATVFITVLSSGTGGQSQCNDGIDNDGDGLVDWQYDLGCYGATDNTEGNAATVALDNGWTVFETSGDSLVIYVSNSNGNDNNDGLSPSTAVKTITKGASLVRHGHHDFLLLKRGDTWSSPGLSKFKSGKDKDHPIVISSYGNSTKRPHVKLSGSFIGHGSQERSHIALVGLSLIAPSMDPRDPDFQGTAVFRGLRLVGGGSNILIEDNKFRYMQLTIQSHNGYQYNNISLRRNIVLDAWAPNSTNSKSGKAQGLYASGIRNGLLIEENTFDHNGWNEEVTDAGASMYGHNIYLQKGQDGKNTVARGNIFTRAASHGLQGRSGGLFEDNLFVRNTYGLLIGGTDPLPSGTTAYALNNVILEGKRMDPNDDTSPQTAAVVGLGIGNTDVGTLKVEGNIVANRIESGINKGIKDQPGAIYVDNIQYDWGGGIGDMTNPGWLDPERSVDSYHVTLGKKGTLEAFLGVVRNRPFRQWPQAYTAYAVNDYIRTGFNR